MTSGDLTIRRLDYCLPVALLSVFAGLVEFAGLHYGVSVAVAWVAVVSCAVWRRLDEPGNRVPLRLQEVLLAGFVAGLTNFFLLERLVGYIEESNPLWGQLLLTPLTVFIFLGLIRQIATVRRNTRLGESWSIFDLGPLTGLVSVSAIFILLCQATGASPYVALSVGWLSVIIFSWRIGRPWSENSINIVGLNLFLLLVNCFTLRYLAKYTLFSSVNPIWLQFFLSPILAVLSVLVHNRANKKFDPGRMCEKIDWDSFLSAARSAILVFFFFIILLNSVGLSHTAALITSWMVSALFVNAQNKRNSALSASAYLRLHAIFAFSNLALTHYFSATALVPLILIQLSLSPWILWLYYVYLQNFSRRLDLSSSTPCFNWIFNRESENSDSAGDALHLWAGRSKYLIYYCAFAVFVFCLWMLDRGFDFMDESYYLNAALYPNSPSFDVRIQEWVTQEIWRMTGTLVSFRAAGLAMLIIGSVVLATGVAKAVNATLNDKDEVRAKLTLVKLWPATLVSTLLYVEVFNFSPSYNLLASSSAYLVAGSVLWAVHAQKILCRFIFLVVAGLSLGIEFIGKPPSAVTTFPLISIWIMVFSRRGLKGKLAEISFISIVSAATIIAFSVGHTTGHDLRISLQGALELYWQSMSTISSVTSSGDRLVASINDWCTSAVGTIKLYWGVLLIMLAAFHTQRPIFTFLAIASLFLTIVYGTYCFKGFYDGLQYAQLVFQQQGAATLMICLLLLSSSSWLTNFRLSVIIFGLIILPYLISVASTVPLFAQVIFSLAPWGLIAAILANLSFPSRLNESLARIVSTCFILFVSIQAISIVNRPAWTMLAPPRYQNYPLEIGSLGTVKVSQATLSFISELKLAANRCGITPGTPSLSLDSWTSGMMLPLQTHPVLYWGSNRSIGAVTKFLNMDDLRRRSLVIALPQNDYEEKYYPLPLEFAFTFKNYKHCGSAYQPWAKYKIQIWHACGKPEPDGRE